MNLEEFRRLFKALEEASIDNCKTPLQSLDLHAARSEYQCEQRRKAKHHALIRAFPRWSVDEGYYRHDTVDWTTDIAFSRDGAVDISYFFKYNIMVYGDEETINKFLRGEYEGK